MAAESSLERHVVRYARERHCLCYKFSSPARRGVPDRIIIGPDGRVLFLELKAPGKRPTALQARELGLLQKQGCMASWTSDLGRAKALIDLVI